MGGMKIYYISEANSDLDNIFDYISQNYYSETIARATIQKIVSGIKRLSTMPNLGVSLDKRLGRKLNETVEIRMLILDTYLVFYFVDDNQVFVMRALAAKQDFMRFLNHFSAIAEEKSQTR